MMKTVLKRTASLVLIFLVALFLFHPILDVFFIGDDFFHFKTAQAEGLSELLNFFKFQPISERGYAFYRPIFRELLYNIFYKLFGLNQTPFRILALLIHFTNTTLVYFLFERLFSRKLFSFIVSLFFAISSANVAILYYLAGGIQVQGAALSLLLSLSLFLKYLEKKKSIFKFLSFIVFLLALASHEQAIVTPGLLAGLIFVKEKRTKDFFRKTLHQLWPFVLTTLVFVYLDVFVIGFSSTEIQYQPVLSLTKVINSFFWYAVWAFGLPEMLIDFVMPGFKLIPSLMNYWGNYFRIIFPTFFVSVGVLVVSFFYTLLRARKKILDKRFVFLVFWFLVSLLPVIFLPLHKSTYYLETGLAAFWGGVWFIVLSAYWGFRKKRVLIARLLVFAFIGALLILNFTSIKLGERTFPAANRGRLAKKLIEHVKKEFPKLPQGAVIYFRNDPEYPFISQDWGGTSRQAYYILSGSDALQLVYNDVSLKVYYEDLGSPPEGTLEDAYAITAKFD